MAMTGCAWLWLYAGAFLMLMELLAPGFVVFFFGLSAAAVGLCRFAFGEAFDATWQIASFSAFAILFLAVLRRWVKKVFAGSVVTSPSDFEHESVGRVGRVVEAIEPPKSGRVLLGDAEWTATADAPVAAGRDVKVVAQSNLTMKVEAI